MGMTIERIIEIYNEFDRIGGILIRGNSEEDTKFNSETIEALQSINVILHKYQKIREILNDDSYYEDYGSKAETFIVSAICEVIEDGNEH